MFYLRTERNGSENYSTGYLDLNEERKGFYNLYLEPNLIRKFPIRKGFDPNFYNLNTYTGSCLNLFQLVIK